jgi:hypothetical protein
MIRTSGTDPEVPLSMAIGIVYRCFFFACCCRHYTTDRLRAGRKKPYGKNQERARSDRQKCNEGRQSVGVKTPQRSLKFSVHLADGEENRIEKHDTADKGRHRLKSLKVSRNVGSRMVKREHKNEVKKSRLILIDLSSTLHVDKS